MKIKSGGKIKEQNKKERVKLISLIEILLLISLSFTIPILYSDNLNNLSVNNFISKITSFFNIIPIVSAQTLGEFDFNSALQDSESGQLGCCFDANEGLCSP